MNRRNSLQYRSWVGVHTFGAAKGLRIEHSFEMHSLVAFLAEGVLGENGANYLHD